MPSTKPQVSVRLSTAELATIDAFRGELSRSAFVQQVVAAALRGLEQPEPLPGLPGGPPPEPRHKPVPGRLALWCLTCNRRVFGDPGWRCPEHPDKTVVQRNRPYFGQEVPTPDIGLPVVDPVDAAWNALNG